MDIVGAILKEIEDPYGRPTDVIGFKSLGKNVANALLPIVGQEEICFFDEKIKSDPRFHYLDFIDMMRKTEIMIFTVELPSKYYSQLDRLNRRVKIFIPKCLTKTISLLEEKQFDDVILL